jgi:UDP-N-acetylglucosamine 2-epimerase (non-hydrolysing)
VTASPSLIDCIVGARPNFVKIAPIMRALNARPGLQTRLIHTGQHYDVAMSAVFFDELAIPEPDINLEVGAGSGTEQTARIMLGLEPVMQAAKPALVIVVGDVNSTLAASLVASKLLIPIAHVEAGLRSGDRAMPEEINRLVTDRLSDLLLVTEPAGEANLLAEGCARESIIPVGNVMIDTLFACLPRAFAPQDTFMEIGAPAPLMSAALNKGFVLATLHRPSNVDDPETLAGLLTALDTIAQRQPVVLPLHPRTRGMIERFGLGEKLHGMITTAPLSYLRLIGLMQAASLTITDSGGVQEETTALGIPCLTVRENTERPITIDEGTNTLIGIDPGRIIAAAHAILDGGGKRGRVPDLWDGRAAERVADAVQRFLAQRAAA